MNGKLRIQRDGKGEPVLLLLHGLGATSDVWTGLHKWLGQHWQGCWIAVDFPGHGGSAALPAYSFDLLAAAVASAVPAASRVVVLGHSLGGAVALALASGRFGVKIDAACAIGIKLAWTDEELARAKSLSTRPNPVYATRAEAAERHLKLAGLSGMIAVEAVAGAALVHDARGWSVAFDPAAFAVGAPDMPAMLAASRASILLAAGEHDPMCQAGPLRALQPDAVVLSGLGHNAHVENPEALRPILERLIG
ncbi:MAG: alpha/beta fold hydrolase [Panacagrimonas sp.]